MKRAHVRGWVLLAAAVAAFSGGCVCLDLTQPRRYRCTADAECMGGWRCGTDHFCVDPSGDALQANSGAPAVSLAQVTPFDAPGLPDLLSSTQEGMQFDSSCADAGPGHGSRWTTEPTLAQVRGDVVMVTAVWPDGREALPDGGLPTGPDCAAGRASPRFQERFTGSLGGRRAVDVAQVKGTTYVLTESGGLCAFQFAPGSSALTGGCKNGVFSFSPTRLRTNPGDRAYLLAHSSSAYALYSLGDGGVGPTATVTISGGRPMAITEMTMTGTGGPNYELLTAINDSGLFVSSLAGYRYEPDGGGTPPFGFWEPVQTAEVGCIRDSTPQYGPPLSMRLAYDYYNSVSGDPLLGIHVMDRTVPGTEQYAEAHAFLYRASKDAGFTGQCAALPTSDSYPPLPSTRIYYGEAVAHCRPCDRTQLLRDWRIGYQYPPGQGDPTLVMEARCVPKDGGTTEDVTVITDVMSACDSFTPTLPDIARYRRPTRWDRSDGYSQAYANDLGHLYGSSFTAGLALPALAMDRAPSVMVQTAAGLGGAVQAELIGDPFDDSRSELIAREVFREGPAGYTGTGNDFFPFFSGVAGRPTWALIGNEASNLYFMAENTTTPVTSERIQLRILAHFNAAVTVQQPFLGAALRNALGREVLMVSSNDALTAVDVTFLADHPDAGGFDEPSFFASPELEVRAVPLPRTPITSLVPLPPDPNEATPLFAEAFLVQGGRVFKVTAFNHTYWKVDELDLGGAEVIAVVADGRRGRAGTKDGKVYALPSRVLVADGLSGAPVLDYAQAGNTTFAVAQGGLFRLRATGETPVGAWEQLDVSPMPPDNRGFQAARLFSISDQLLLFLHSGWGYRVSGGR